MRRRQPKIEQEIRRFVEREILDGATSVGDPFAEGAVDSLALERFLAFAEERYGVTFEDEELSAERFTDIPSVAALILDKRASAAS